MCCRKEAPWAKNKTEEAGIYGFLGLCETPPITAESFLRYAQDVIKPDIILWLGDNNARNVWELNRTNHLDTFKHIANNLKRTYNKIGDVYPILGNHEGYPYDQFDSIGNSHKWLLADTEKESREWLTEEARATYLLTGSYTQLHPKTKLRIIAINPFVLLNSNKFQWRNQTDPLETVI